MNNKMHTKLIITIIIIGIIILSYLFYYPLIASILSLKNNNLKYEVDGPIINIKNKNITIETIDNYYDLESKCYIIKAIINKNNKKTKKSFFESLFGGEYLEVEYILSDKDDYILGTTSLSIDDIYENNKWKISAYYCGDDALNIVEYKVGDVNIY